MDHAQAQEQFSDYWEGGLAAPERAAVAAHLEGCAECRAEYERFQAALAPLGKLRTMAVPEPDLQVSVPALINRRSQGRFFSRRSRVRRLVLTWLPPLMLALVALLYLAMKLANPLLRAN